MPPSRAEAKASLASNALWFIDENLIGVGKALRYVRPDVVYPGHPSLPCIELGTSDSAWLPKVGRLGLGVITRDTRINRRKEEITKMVTHSVKAFILTAAGDLTNWELLCLLTRHWEKMEYEVQKPGPFAHAVTKQRLRAIKLG